MSGTRTGDHVRLSGTRWGWRLIRPGGRVFWQGRWHKIEDGPMPRAEYEALPRDERPRPETPKPKYDGSMDGMWGLFYSYEPHAWLDLIHLWGVEGEPWPGPTCVAGVFVWETFKPEVKP